MTRTRVFGIAAILLALACWAGAAVVAFTAFESQASWSAPGSTTAQLSAGKWTVFQKLPADSTAVTQSDIAAARTVKSEQVTVTDSSGATVATTCAYCTTTPPGAVPLDLQLANPIADFSVINPGAYTITVKDSAGQMSVADPVKRLENVAPWILLLSGGGGILLAAGIVLVVRGRGSPASGSTPGGPPAPSAAPEPGWYPNPYLPGTDSQMWWDGSKWTSNWR